MRKSSQGKAADQPRGNLAERLREAMGAQLRLAMGAAGKTGPKALLPRLVLRKDRPIEGEPGISILFCGRKRALGLPETQMAKAETALALALMSRELEDDGDACAAKITIAEIIDWHLDQRKPAMNRSEREQRVHDRLGSRLGNVRRILGGSTVRKLDERSITQYVNKRMSEPHKQYKNEAEAPRVSDATARSELGDLKRAIKAFHRQFKLDWVPDIDDKRRRTRRNYLLTRNGMARVLMASRGYVWDPAADGWHVILVGGHRDRKAKFKRVFLRGKGGWKTEEDVDPETGVKTVRYVRRTRKTVMHRRAVARLSLLGVYSGTRHNAMIGLSWVRHPGRGCIDVIHDTIHRLGYGEDPNEGKPRHSSVMRPKLSFFADIWLNADRRHGIAAVIHRPDGTPFQSLIQELWWETVADAGLPNLQVHHLRHAGITWMMHDGKTTHETAEAMGLTVQTIEKTYRQPSLAAQRVRRRWGYHQVAKGWDTVDIVDPADDAYHARMNQRVTPGAIRARRHKQRPITGRSVRQPLRRRKPMLPRKGPRAS